MSNRASLVNCMSLIEWAGNANTNKYLRMKNKNDNRWCSICLHEHVTFLKSCDKDTVHCETDILQLKKTCQCSLVAKLCNDDILSKLDGSVHWPIQMYCLGSTSCHCKTKKHDRLNKTFPLMGKLLVKLSISYWSHLHYNEEHFFYCTIPALVI